MPDTFICVYVFLFSLAHRGIKRKIDDQGNNIQEKKAHNSLNAQNIGVPADQHNVSSVASSLQLTRFCDASNTTNAFSHTEVPGSQLSRHQDSLQQPGLSDHLTLPGNYDMSPSLEKIV